MKDEKNHLLLFLQRWWFLILIFLFVCASAPIAVKNMNPSRSTFPLAKANAAATSQWISFSINGNVQAIDSYQDNVWYDVPMLTSEFDTTIAVENFSGYTMKVNDLEIQPNESVSVRLASLMKSKAITVELAEIGTGAVRRHFFRTLPDAFVNAEVLTNNPEKGYYYFNMDHYIYKMDTLGNIVFFKFSPGGCDFHRTELDGKVWYSYLEAGPQEAHPPLTDVGYASMRAIVMNENYQVVDTIPCLIPNGAISEGQPLENHQFTILGEKHYLLSSYAGKRVNNIGDAVPHSKFGARVAAAVIQEIQNGTVVFQWDSTEHPELYALSTEGNDFYNITEYWADYAHFNAVVVDPKDQNFLCSFRHLDAILKIDRSTGEILWILGGKGDQFGLTDEEKFYHQHDIRIAQDGGITLFNNGNEGISTEKGMTSIMKFYLDESNKIVTKFQEYSIEGAFSPAMGSAQELSDGRFVIGWGHRASALPLFSEVDFHTNQVLFEFVRPAGTVVHESSYRVYKSDK